MVIAYVLTFRPLPVGGHGVHSEYTDCIPYWGKRPTHQENVVLGMKIRCIFWSTPSLAVIPGRLKQAVIAGVIVPCQRIGILETYGD